MVKKLQRVSPQKVTTGQLPELTQNVREQVPTWLKLLLTKYGETEGRLVGLEAEPKPEEERIGPPPPTQEEESKLSNLLEQMAEEGLDVAPDRNVPTSVEWSSAAQPVEPPVAPLDDFLAGLGDTGVEENYDTPAGYEQAPLYEEHTPVPGAEVPDWLTDTGPEQGDYDQTPSDFTVSEQPSTAASPPSSSGGQEVPDWLTEALETPSSASEAPAFTSPSAPAVSDEEVPDWLTEALEETPDTALPVESQQFSPSFPPEAETPDWLTESPSAPEAATGPESSMPAETPAWLTETEMPAAEGWETVSPLAESTPDFAADIPDWQIPDWITEGIDEVAGPAESASAEPDIPDWIAQGETFVETDAAPESSEFPDWLTPLAETTPPPSSVAPVEEDIPDWLAAEPAAPQPAMADETEPDWLFDTPPAAAETSIAAAETPAEQEPVGPIQDIPGWLQNIQTEPGSLPAAPSAGMPRWLENIQSPTEISPPPLGQPPGWLENIQTTPGSQPPAPVAEQTVEPGPMMADADDWLTGLGAPPLDDTPVAAVKTPNLVESEDWLADFDAPAPGDTSVAEAAPSAEPDWFGDSGIALGPDTAAAPASQTGDDLTWPPETDLPPAVAFPEEETEESASGTRPASTLKRLKPLKRLSPKPASPTLPNWAASLIPATAETGQMPFALPDWAAQLVPAGASSGEEAATLLPDWAGALIPAGFETKAEETAGLAEIQEEVVLDAEAEMFSEPLPPTETRPEPLPPAEQEQDTLAWLTGLREALPSDEASTAYEVVEPGPEAEIEMPDWLTETEELPAEPMPEAVAPEPAIPEAEIKLPDWLMEEEAPVEPAPTEPVAEVELEIPDWLGRVEETPVEGEGKVEPETPPWLAEWPEAEQAEPLPPEAASEEELEMPDWLSGIQETSVEGEGKVEPETPPWLAEWPEAEQAEPAPTEPAPEAEIEMPDWLMRGLEETPVEGEGEVEPETPPWLAEWPEAEQAEPLSPEAASEEELEMPDWLSGIQETPVEEKGEMEPDTPPWLAEWPEAEQVESAPTEPAAEVEPETPAWLTELPEAPDTGLLSSLPEPKSATKAEPEMPDWLSDLPKAPDTGTLSLRQHDTPAPLSEAEESPGGEFSTEPAAEEELELPAWLSELPEVEAEHPPAAPVTPATGGEREMPEWLSEVEETPAEPSLEPIPEEELELPAWLSELPQEVTKEPPAIGQVEAVDEAKTEETGWLSDIKIPSVEQPPAASPAEDTFDLEWLSETTPAGMEQVPAAEIESDTPWLADEDEDEEPPLPPWLAEDEEPETSPPTVSPASSPGKSTDKEEPAWLSALDEPMVSEKQPATPEKAETAEEEADLPAWLFDSPETTSADETGEDMAGKPSSGEDWLAGLREATEAVEAVLPSEESKPATSPPPISPPPTIDKADPHKSDEPKPGGPKASQALPPSSGADSPVRGQAPGWLQALKPAETVEMVLEAEDGQAVESTGVLAGLTGLLPAEKMVTAIPTITPKPANGHADATLQAAQDFYAIATQPPQPAVLPTLPGQLHKRFIINNVIRTGLFILFIILLALPLWPGWSKTTPWTEPPPEVSDVLGDRRRQMISEQLGIIDRQQPGAVALVSFDFSTATQGEMQPLAEAIIGRLRGQGMRVILVSLEPEGAALAQTLLDNRDDAYGVEVINLGYLPGQVVAVRELATGRKQLSTIKDFKEGVSLENRSDWGNVHNLHQIDLLVTLADNPATVKWWVEQMEIVSSLGQDKQFLLAATSATAAPFLQPYRHSGQLDGLIAGINGAAAIEASRQQFGPARQMLDSQSIAHLLIIVLIVAGIVAGWMPRLSSPEPEKQAEETT